MQPATEEVRPAHQSTLTRHELLVERQTHICSPEFVDSFKHLYETMDPGLFQNSLLQHFNQDDTQLDALLQAFKEQITSRRD
jgi:hypothetical protein